MNPFFAEFVPDGNFLLQLLGSVGFLAIIGDRIWTWVKRGDPQKRQVSFETIYATKEELAELKENAERQITELRDTLGRMETAAADRRREIYLKIEESRQSTNDTITDLRKEIKEDINGVHARVTDLVKGVSEIVGQLKMR
jgi:chromosome segregation ATPase